MDNKNQTQNAPALAAWVLCALSLCMLFWGVVAVVEIGEYLRKKVTANRIKLALDGSNPRLGRTLLTRALSAQGVADWVNFTVANDDCVERYIDLTFETIELIDAAGYATASVRLEALRASFPEISGIDGVQGIDQWVNEAKPLLQSLTLISEKYKQKSDESKELEEQKRKLYSNYQIIAREFADFFSLAAIKAESEKALPVYEEGVLAGLPRLHNLEDGIEDLQALARALEFARGKVQLDETENAHQAFMQKMSYFKKASKPFVTRDKEIRKKLDGMSHLLHVSETELKNNHYMLNGKLWRILFKLLEANRSPSRQIFAKTGNYLELLFF